MTFPIDKIRNEFMKPQGGFVLVKNVIALSITHMGKISHSFQCSKPTVKLEIIKLMFFIYVTASVWMCSFGKTLIEGEPAMSPVTGS